MVGVKAPCGQYAEVQVQTRVCTFQIHSKRDRSTGSQQVDLRGIVPNRGGIGDELLLIICKKFH